MKISYNAAAMRASNALNASDNKVSKSLGRLSSGLKVTSSKDNPSGYAIGRRMNTQITGIGSATQNSNNGISVIETADGALTEVHEMLQRMNELAVKGETGTLTTTDRMTLDAEVKQLKQEITRISTDTQFNGQTLLDGTFDLRGYTNNHKVKVDYYSDEVIAKEYMIGRLAVDFDEKGNIVPDSIQIALMPIGDNSFPEGVKVSEVVGRKITLTGPLDFQMTLELEKPDTVPAQGVNMVEDTKEATKTVEVIGLVNGGLAPDGAVYFYPGPPDGNGYYEPVFDMIETQKCFDNPDSIQHGLPEDAKIVSYTRDRSDYPLLTDTIIVANEKGFLAEITCHPEFKTLEEAGGTPPEYPAGWAVELDNPAIVKTGLILDITGIGTMDIQTGANEGQQLAIRIPTISLARMNLEDLRMTTSEECAEANKAIKSAILYVSDARSRLGAYQNRLEHTVNNLAVSNENMTASYSRIMDVDMAEEMTNYTTEQVISQAAVSMLAQANERPSQVLQLLQ